MSSAKGVHERESMESEGDQSRETEAAPSSGPIWKAGLGGGNLLSFEELIAQL